MSSHCFFFSKFYIFCRQYGRYIPTVLPMESMSSVIITDKKGLLVQTNKIRDEIISVGKNDRQKKFRQ